MHGQLIRFEAGDIMIREGSFSRKMFLIRSGRARVFKEYMNRRVILAVVGEGEVCGELSFFDAEPRSASVEALGPVEAYVVDAEESKDSLETVPEWLLPVLRSVFNRLRISNDRATVLESLNEFQRRAYGVDVAGQSIYHEVLRYLHVLHLLQSQKNLEVKDEKMIKEMESLLGRHALSVKVFLKKMCDLELVSISQQESLKNYLHDQIHSEKFTVLSYAALNVLRHMLGRLDPNADRDGFLEYPVADLKATVLLLDDAIEELVEANIIVKSGALVRAPASTVEKVYAFQCFLKSFDHSVPSGHF
jgi:CRP-like cAMP-binding protein